MDHSPEMAAIAEALAKAQGEMHSAEKLATNPHFRSHYATLAHVRDALREPLAANGLAVVQSLANDPIGVRVTTMLVHSSGQWFRDALVVPCVKMDAQGLGSAATYGLRYSLQAITGIAPDDAADDDGESNRQAAEAKPARVIKPMPPPAQPTDQPSPEDIEAMATDAINDLDGATPEARVARLKQIEERIGKRKELSDEQKKRLATLIVAKRAAWGESIEV